MSKNPGGSKRVTSLADALKLNFGIITTDRRRETMGSNMFLDASGYLERLGDSMYDVSHRQSMEHETDTNTDPAISVEEHENSSGPSGQVNGTLPSLSLPHRQVNNINGHHGSSHLMYYRRLDGDSPPTPRTPIPRSAPARGASPQDNSADEYTDERAPDVITGRLIQGHLVDDDAPSPVFSTMSGSVATLPGDLIGPPQLDEPDPMTSSFMSTLSNKPSSHALGGSIDAAATSDEEDEGFKNPEIEHTITLVGDVRDRTVFIMDDMIDQCGSWIAAAETAVKRGGAKSVYCIATHGLFGYDSLEEMEKCECIDFIVVTNTYPIASERIRASRKLIVLDISGLLAEAIRRNHNGESISQLFQHYTD